MNARHITFQKKMYLSVLTLIFLLLITCVTLFYAYTANALMQNSQDSLSSSTTLLLSNLDNLLKNADNSLKELQTNDTLFSIAKKIPEISDNYFSVYSSKRNSFQSAFRSLVITQGYDASLSYISSGFDYVTIANSSVQLDDKDSFSIKSALSQKQELSALMDDIAYMTYLPPHDNYFSKGSSVFSVARSMRDTYRSYGILLMDFDVSLLTDLLFNFKNPEDYSIVILNEDQEFLYTSDPTINRISFLEKYKEALSKGSDIFSFDDTTESCSRTSSLTGWTFVLTSSLSGYLSSTDQLLWLCVFVFIFLFASIAIFLHLVSKRLARPLEQLSSQLQTMEPNRLMEFTPISGTDEIGILANKIQTYLTEIYHKNKQLAESHQRTLKAHYDAMEAQLNPHFLYNTLSVIGMTGLNTGNVAVSDMCGELASLLRYSLSYARQSVRLEQEVTNAHHYLYIMKCRFESNLIYEWDWESALDKVSVPKLILQPLIENCFQHGFKSSDANLLPPWRIRISSRQEESCWYITVSNNGQPFSQEKLAQLYRHFDRVYTYDSSPKNVDEIWQHHGFGLENTILRLNIYYHGKAFFQVSATEEGWTSVTIGGPLCLPPDSRYFSEQPPTGEDTLPGISN